MKLSDYVVEEKKIVDEFEQWWHEQHLEYPERFPLEMSLADWCEQYVNWSMGL